MLINALDMVPGKTYRITTDGPLNLDGLVITPSIIVAFDSEGVGEVPTGENHLLQVQYDAWGYPLPEVTVFAPFDVVWEVPTNVGDDDSLCSACWHGYYGSRPNPVKYVGLDDCRGCGLGRTEVYNNKPVLL